MFDYLENLNEEQKRAVCFEGKHAVVVSGAGTGKTRTIVHRALHLLNTGVDPKKILILSFTKKSAREIVNRIKALNDNNYSINLYGQTFHSFCAYLIMNNPECFAQHDYTIIEPEDIDDLYKMFFVKIKDSYPHMESKLYQKIGNVYSYARNTGIKITESIEKILCKNMYEEETKLFLENNKEAIITIIKMYMAYKNEHKAFDYDDLLYVAAEVLEQNDDIREFITKKYEHILIDEFQDTNPLQYKLLKSFYKNSHLFCVGDEAQSIYAFRGADFKLMHNFTHVVDDSERLTLDINYRSTQEILDLANWLLNQSPIDYNKNLRSVRGSGAKPVIFYCKDQYEESGLVINKIQRDLIEKNLDYKDHLVVARSNFGLKAVEADCILKKIPYRLLGGSSLLKSRHIRDMISVIRIMANNKDIISWLRFLQLFDKIGPATATKVTEAVVACETIEESISILDNYKLNPVIKETLVSALKHVNNLQMLIENVLVLMDTRFSLIYKEEWNQWRKSDFEVLEKIAANSDSPGEFITEYILDPNLEYNVLSGKTEDDYVTLSTVHSAKGLEAKVCHVLNVTPYTYPSPRAIADSIDAIEEERRTLYVALTRAEDELYIYSRSTNFVPGGGIDDRNESHYFLNNLPEKYISSDASSFRKYKDEDRFIGKAATVKIDDIFD